MPVLLPGESLDLIHQILGRTAKAGQTQYINSPWGMLSISVYSPLSDTVGLFAKGNWKAEISYRSGLKNGPKGAFESGNQNKPTVSSRDSTREDEF